MKEPAGERDEPDQGKDDGQASDNFGVDGAAVRPIVENGKRVDVVADKTCNDGWNTLLAICTSRQRPGPVLPAKASSPMRSGMEKRRAETGILTGCSETPS